MHQYLTDVVNYLYQVIKPSKENEHLLENTRYLTNVDYHNSNGFFTPPNIIAVTNNMSGSTFIDLIHLLAHETMHKYVYENNLRKESKNKSSILNQTLKKMDFQRIN